ncbi:trypsin-like serine peptidase [Singulisphaera acidiphila]|uniref:trypsin-like serine peptidase n=1 Tax=Singulisphaera acidiphila TaxID=466153 RepID=UPI00036D4C02|nr:serine protease [Singulisphaera acidiphila]
MAIRLKRQGDQEVPRTYLLTCAHVVRGTSKDRKPGFGPVLSQLRVWAPDTGYNDAQAKTAKIVMKIKPNLTLEEVIQAERSNASDDWVVLEIDDPQASTAAPAVREWADSDLTGDFRIYGYPGGTLSFSQGMVNPTRTPDSFSYRDEFQGVVRLLGDGTRPGISGGGVFRKDDEKFVGIHRAREDDTLRLNAVSVRTIRQRLEEQGYLVVNSPSRPPAPAAMPGMSPAVKNDVIRFNEKFVQRREQFRYLSGFKQLHEGLHNLQAKREAISQAAERFKQDPNNPFEIENIGEDLIEDYKAAVRSTALLEDPSDAGWVEAYGLAVSALRNAVTERDLNALSSIVEVLRALPNQQAGLNAELVRCAKRLKPLELVNLMDVILAGLNPDEGFMPTFIAEFRDRLNRFRTLCDNLSVLIKDHDCCQRVETSLAQAETVANVVPALVPGWDMVKADLQGLALRRPTDTLANRIVQLAASFESTAGLSPQVPKPIGNIFALLIERFRRFFLTLDEELLDVTNSLVQEAGILDAQLRTATQVN